MVFRSSPAFAVDAHGDRVYLTPHWDGKELELVGDGSQLVAPIVVDPTWSATGPLVSQHGFGRTATLLPSGKVLVAGGQVAGGVGATCVAELWDPVSKTWKTTAPMSTQREGHAAFVSGGNVVVCGSNSNSTCEAYSPSTDAWSPAGVLSDRRGYGAFVALGGGKFLLAGGYNAFGFLSTAEIYDEATSSWTSAGALSNARAYGHAVVFGGKAYVIGGRGAAGSVASVDVYDLTAKTWTAGPSMASPRDVFAAVVLPTGKLLVAGGSGASGSMSFAEFFDPTTAKWSAAPTKPTASDGYGLPLPGGAFVSSMSSEDVQLFDSETNTWIAGPPTSIKARLAVSLGGGSVLAMGSSNTSFGDTTAELYVSTANGGGCTKSVQCASGVCVGGICGGGDAGPTDTGPVDTGLDTGATDAVVDAPPGTKADGAACGGAGECISGFCTDGVCCNVACDGQCQACDLGSKVGTCAVVSGAPHGSRPKCGDSAECAGKCDGVDTQKCVYPAAGGKCASTCEGTNAVSKACDGKGSCAPQSTVSCAPFLCVDGLCPTVCTKNADCDVNSVCRDGVCAGVDAPAGSSGGCGCTVVGQQQAIGGGAAALGWLLIVCRRVRRRAGKND
ncbi:MAG: hypothetical protein IPJ34_28220 [Myxococcales bacterium]|nr:hypothetical protein [Myxococcales bacterium]